jgi:hypothetical protein
MRVEAAHIPSHSDPVPRAESGRRRDAAARRRQATPLAPRARMRVCLRLYVGHNSVTRIYTEIRVTDTGTSRQGRSAF